MKHVFLLLQSGSNAGLTSASIGLVRSLDRMGIDSGFYRPFSQRHKPSDHASEYLRQVMDINPPPTVSLEKVEQYVHEGKVDQLLEEVVETVDSLLEKHDVVVVGGLIPTSDLPFADMLNTEMARSMNAEIVIVKRPSSSDFAKTNRALERFISALPEALRRERPAVILNKVPQSKGAMINIDTFPTVLHDYRQQLSSSSYDLLGLIPETPEIQQIRVSDLVKELKAEIIHDGNLDSRRVGSIVLCARHVENVIQRLKTGTLLVCPADRSDILIAAALSVHKGIELAGIVLTSELAPSENIIEFCNDAFDQSEGLPILKVDTDSYETAHTLVNLSNDIAIDDHKRIDMVMTTVARFIDTNWLRTRISSSVKKRLSPVAFKHYLAREARHANKRILLPEGEEERTIKAALDCASRSLARCVLMGDPKKMESKIKALSQAVPDNLELLNPADIKAKYIAPLYERRKHKGLTLELAEEQLEDNILLATTMVAEGDADGLVAGAIHSTAHTVSPALKIIKPAPGNQIVSSVFFMCLPDQVYLYADCAVNPDPNAEQLAEIAIQSAQSARAFGIEPKIAMISYSTLGSGSGSEVQKVIDATALVKQRAPELLVDGPLQYDAATTPSVAQKKAPGSPVAGQANVLIFPDLNTGNTTYKAVQRSANVDSIGPALQGLNRPVNDLSRGAMVDDIIYTIAVTAIQCTI